MSPAKRDKTIFRQLIKEVSPIKVFINGIFSKEFSILPLRAAAPQSEVIVSARGMLKPSALQIKGTKKKVFLTLAKYTGLYKNVIFQATDEVEKQDILRVIGSSTKVRIAPNLPKSIGTSRPKKKQKPPGRLKMVFAGRIAPEKNLLYALQVLSEMDTDGMSLTIIGAHYDEVYWQKCIQAMDTLKSRIPIDMVGEQTPEETMQALASADVLFLPTRGENFGHVILESLMCGTPVVISDNTPWRKLMDDGVGADINLADKSLFQHYLHVLRDMPTGEFDDMCAKAYHKAKAYCQDERVLRLNKDLFSSDG